MCSMVVLNLFSEWVTEGGPHEVDGRAIHLDEVRGAPVGARWSATEPPREALWGFYEACTLIKRDRDTALLEVVKWKWDKDKEAFAQDERRKYMVYLDSGNTVEWHWDD